MRIHVEGDYYISYDGRNHTLEREVITEKGKNKGSKRVEVEGNYPNITSCMKAMLKLEIMESSATNLRELMVDVARIETKIEVVMAHVKFQVKKIVAESNLKMEETG